MIKKILFTLFLLFSVVGFSQEKSVEISIEKLSAAPNPFSNETKITFNAVSNSQIIFTVKNILGKTLHTENLKATLGNNTIPFSKGNLATGIYIYSIQSEKNSISKRFVIK
ncbi:MAG: T9SS type A sorting domain-containing protein [Polaribacter sp.]|uniref:T9SS type A sorting domain-containing protein n=1 Tax=Polaribacter sp. TaxID=1920175 RepID=UPI003BAF9F1F